MAGDVQVECEEGKERFSLFGFVWQTEWGMPPEKSAAALSNHALLNHVSGGTYLIFIDQEPERSS
jgi:hypothetical protein